MLSAIDEAVIRTLAAARVAESPINAVMVARELGFDLAWDRDQTGRARTCRTEEVAQQRKGRIYIRQEPREERIHWAVAHELGEHLAEEILQSGGADVDSLPSNGREQIANLFATRLLLPTEWFKLDAADLEGDLPALKERYETASHELIARRMLDFEQPVLITIFDHGKPTFRRWNRPTRTPPLTEAERAVWREVHDRGVAVRRNGPLRIDGWPIHEPDWKREILRVELPEYCDDLS